MWRPFYERVVRRMLGITTMQKATFVLALAAFLLALGAWLRPERPHSVAATQSLSTSALTEARHEPEDERTYPPLVLSGRLWLDCFFSSTRNGQLKLHWVDGQGFGFNTPLRPVKDAKISFHGLGLRDEFNAFPVADVATCLKGLGDGTITRMKVEVWFNLKRYRRLPRVRNSIHFDLSSSGSDPPYAELTGLFIRRSDAKKFPFRVVFGSIPTGNGDISIQTSDLSQTLRFGSQDKPATVITSLYEKEDDVKSLHLN